MPAKELSQTQKADAVRLKQAFKAWQSARRAQGLPASQEEVSDELHFGQSALSQYLNGNIPLNADALRKLCSLIGVSPETISPTIVKQERERAIAWLGADVSATLGTTTNVHAMGTGSDRGGRIASPITHADRPKKSATNVTTTKRPQKRGKG